MNLYWDFYGDEIIDGQITQSVSHSVWMYYDHEEEPYSMAKMIRRGFTVVLYVRPE